MPDQLFAVCYAWKQSMHFVRLFVGTLNQAEQRFRAALQEHHDSLVIFKAFPVGADEGAKMMAEWKERQDYAPAPGWRPFSYLVREQLENGPCETMRVKKLMEPCPDRVEWRPKVKDKRELMEDARLDEKLPAFVVNGRSYVLWAISDFQAEGISPTPRQIHEHKANSGFYKRKTIYNELTELFAEGKISKDGLRRAGLTDAGANELTWLEDRFTLSQSKNPRTLRIV
jgi:hypothetical protein